MSKKPTYATLSILAAASLALAGCGQTGTAPAPSESVSTAQSSAALTVSESWAKALDSGMTPVFGTLENTSDQDITVTSATTGSAKSTELHETVMGSGGTMQMQPKKGGFVIPAKSKFKLEPGGNHIMLMGLTQPVKAGDDISVELKLTDGSTTKFTAQVKDFAGAKENYIGGERTAPGQGTMGSSHGSMATPSPTPSK